MKIWVVNDDGIDYEGIKVLVRHAKKFGDVTVIAPAGQCSGMSQHISMIVFSGINHGENAGIDVLYSGTVGACMEALVQGYPAIAFSLKWEATGYELVDETIDGIIGKLLTMKLPGNQIWNVNFPAHKPDAYKGILWDRVPSQRRYRKTAAETNDVDKADRIALDQGYISIGTITNMALVP